MKTVLEALNSGLRQCLKASPDVYLLGEDLLDPYGGAFKVVKGLSTEFPDHVITTPVSEAGIVGLGTGMALRGLRPVVEIMFGDFLALAADQLINHAAKFRWMSNDQVCVPLVVRTPVGGYRGYGPTHSQSLEKHFLGTPGLRVLALNTMVDSETLLHHVILDEDDPVLLIEHKLLYPLELRAADQELVLERSAGPYPWTTARVRGAPPPVLTLTCYGYMAEIARQAQLRLAYEDEIFIETVVPIQLSPFELEVLQQHTARTMKLITLEEGSLNLGWGAEITARMAEVLGGGLRLKRIAARNMPIGAAATLEAEILPQVENVVTAARALLENEGSLE